MEPTKVPFVKTVNELKPGKYQHFKGNLYEVMGVARHSKTLEELVVYKVLYDSKDFGSDSLWVRPMCQWHNESHDYDGKNMFLVSTFRTVDSVLAPNLSSEA